MPNYRRRTRRYARGARRPARRTTRVIRRTRPIRRRRISRRAILNVSSTKKQDNMLTWIPSNPVDPAGAGTTGDATLAANQTFYANLFCPTARLIDGDGITKYESSGRQNQFTYSKGYKEVTTVRLTGPTPYRLRRMVFSLKGFADGLRTVDTTFIPDFFTHYVATGGIGYVRQVTPLTNPATANVHTYIFKGTANRDWFSPFNAKLDTQFLKVHSDRTYNFNPPNQGGVVRILKNWYPTNKNLVYDDDENGTTEASSPFSTNNSNSMGDLFVYDIWQSINTDASSQLSFNHEGTYYWHER